MCVAAQLDGALLGFRRVVGPAPLRMQDHHILVVREPVALQLAGHHIEIVIAAESVAEGEVVHLQQRPARGIELLSRES